MIKKDFWDKIKIIFTILTPITILISGYLINLTLQENEIKVKYIEIAIDILKTEPTKENTELRLWAIKIIKEYSQIAISPEIELELINNSLINYLTDHEGNYITDHEGNRLTTN